MERAKQLGLVGWVMNASDGTVVGQAQGNPSALQDLCVHNNGSLVLKRND